MSSKPNARAHLAAPENSLASQCEAALLARGVMVVRSAIASLAASEESTDESVLCMVLEGVPSGKHAVQLAERVARHASRGVPPIVLVPYAPPRRAKTPTRSGDEHAASLALLRARGAIVLRAPDIWLECVILLAAHGVPSGPQGAIVAEPGAWLAISAAALQKRAEALGERFSPSAGIDGDQVTDFVLTDTTPTSPPKTGALYIPIGVVASAKAALVGLGNSLAAAEAAGQASRRIAAGDSRASADDAPSEEFDMDRFERQLDKLADTAGDHECKVLLSSYGVSITRQAVATTPSAATRIAKKAGYPVQIKAWGPQQPSEPEGALVISDVATAADVRRSFSSVCARANSEAVIIRETPMRGREVQVHFRPMGAIGLVCFLYQRGHQEPAAALAPLRQIDADTMARHVVASRAGDTDPDWTALASLLLNASHMVANTPRLVSVELNRVIVGNQGQGALVVDARARLSPTRD